MNIIHFFNCIEMKIQSKSNVPVLWGHSIKLSSTYLVCFFKLCFLARLKECQHKFEWLEGCPRLTRDLIES